MGNAITLSLETCFRPLIDLFYYIFRILHEQVQNMFLPTAPIPNGDETKLVDNNLTNSNRDLESISVIYKDLCAIAENNTRVSVRNISTESSPEYVLVNIESDKDILDDKISSDNSTKRDELQIKNDLIAEKDLTSDSAQNGISIVSSSKPSQSVMLNGESGSVLNANIYNNLSKENESRIKNGITAEINSSTVSSQNGVNKFSTSKSPSQPYMLNEDFICVLRNDKVSNDNATEGNDKLQIKKSLVNENGSQNDSGKTHNNRVCRYSLEPIHCRTGSLSNSNGKTAQVLSCKEKPISSVENNAASYIDDVIRNDNSYSDRTEQNVESQTKSYPNDGKESTSFAQNNIGKIREHSSRPIRNETGDLSNTQEQIQQILRCFEKSRSSVSDIKDSNLVEFQVNLCDNDTKTENRISLDNNKLRMRRLGINYARSSSLDVQHPADSSSSSQQNADNLKVERYPRSQALSTCDRHPIKRVSLPNAFSGGLYATTKEAESLRFPKPSLKTLKVPHETYRVLSSPDLQCGGLVVFEELSRHISLPNLYTQDPIVIKEPFKNLKFPVISSSDDLRIKRKISGGGLVEENDSRKISLSNLISKDRSLEDFTISSGYGSTSGGGLINAQETDHIFYSDIHSNTVICEQMSSVRKCLNSEHSLESNMSRAISESDISDIYKRNIQDSDDETRRNSSAN